MSQDIRPIPQTPTMTRRSFVLAIPALGLAAAAFPRRVRAAQAAVQTFNGPMADAGEVYRPVTLPPKPGATPSMTDAQRDELEHQIHCQCGCQLDVFTCRTTDFACSVSPAMHSDVMGMVAGGHSAQEILAAFKAIYGEKVLMAPVRSGFNLLGYTVPFIALGTGAVIVAELMRRWKRAPAPVSVGMPHVDATEGELAALDAAVRHDR
ncbi:MAG TPA: cytochrome c-type biogenesis protein CcmH [Gemmatimonadaceae bacterium]|nr:cytochrome c-type biogenesis protein CcmH [Gemmatimonadaceae bacterium]